MKKLYTLLFILLAVNATNIYAHPPKYFVRKAFSANLNSNDNAILHKVLQNATVNSGDKPKKLVYKIRINGDNYELNESEFNNIMVNARQEMISKGGIRTDRIDKVIVQFKNQAKTGVYDYDFGKDRGEVSGGGYEGENEATANLGGKGRVTGWNKLWNNEKNDQTIMSSLNYHFGSHACRYIETRNASNRK